jgi:DNA primase/energy-coupling factor transporter ATP-binding protein EcfA2
MEIKDIKERLTLSAVIQHYGFKADKYNRINCPFHNDKTPSMQLYWKTHTAYCFSANCTTHGKSLDVIDFIMNMEKSNKHEAIKKAESLITGTATTTPQELTRTAILTRMFTYFKNSVHNSKPAQEYIRSRNLDPTRIEIGYNTGQFHHGTRRDEALISSCVKVGLLTPWGTAKTGEQAYKVFAKECICFALRNRSNQITGLYFRSTTNNSAQRHFYLKDRQGLYPHYPKPETKILILTESIIDAATLLQQDSLLTTHYTLLSLYGTNGLTEEHTEAIKELKELEEIIFFLNGDEAGRKATAKHAETLKALRPEIKITSVNVPENEDINSLAQAHEPSVFTHLLESRSLFFSTEVLPEKNGTSRTEGREENPEPIRETSGSLDTSNPYKIAFRTETANYYIQGGIRSEADSMKVTLVIEHPTTKKKSRNKLDLYEDKQIEKTAREAGEKLQLRSDLIEADISELVDHLDQYRELRNTNDEVRIEETVYPLTSLERKQAEELLKTKDLFIRLNELIGKAGVVGEEQTRLFLFVIASSYKMPDTLHALVQGSSGSGKTHLIVNIAQLMPPEDVKFLTRVTEGSFYNYGEYELCNTLFCMEDLDGLKEDAFLAFRELISRKQLASSTTVKDEKGEMRGKMKTVRGPIASLSATTKGAIYEDNMGRCFLVSVDESPEQTQRIIEYQNKRASGKIDIEEEKRITTLLRNCIRILQPLEVLNPYAGQITLPEEAHKIRRLNDLYQGFVRQVTLINQYKRKKDDKGRLIAEKEDLEQASEIMFDSIMLKVDELDGSLRQFYERLKTYVQSKGKEYKNYAFGRKEIRDALRVSKTQQHRFFNDLSELEYITQSGGNSHAGHKYKILVWDDMQALRARIKRYLQGQLNQLGLFDNEKK